MQEEESRTTSRKKATAKLCNPSSKAINYQPTLLVRTTKKKLINRRRSQLKPRKLAYKLLYPRKSQR